MSHYCISNPCWICYPEYAPKFPPWEIKTTSLWTIDLAREFCNKLHDHLAPFNYDIGLTGGVLLRGESNKDIDVIVYPLKKISADFEAMHKSLLNFGMSFVRLPNENRGHADDGKHVEVWEFEGKRIDLFFLT